MPPTILVRMTDDGQNLPKLIAPIIRVEAKIGMEKDVPWRSMLDHF